MPETVPDFDDVPNTDDGMETMGQWRRSVTVELKAHRTAASERAGASKLVAWLLLVFGSLGGAALIAGFGWMWSSNEDLVRASETADDFGDHTKTTHPAIEARQRDTEMRVTGLEAAQKSLIGRIDQRDETQAERFDSILTELRRRRR